MRKDQRTFVLVHGAFHGGWCWRHVATQLQAEGHRVFTPTLTGLGERAHLRDIDPDLDLHIADIVQMMFCEELEDAILVGHSYAGAVISGVADCMAHALRRLVFLDALVLPPGRHVLHAASAEALAYYRSLDREAGGSALIPAPAADFFGIRDAERAAWADRHLSPQPLATFMTPLRLSNPLGNGLPVTYIHCTDPEFTEIRNSFTLAQTMPGWEHIELASGHDAMISAPEALARILTGLD